MTNALNWFEIPVTDFDRAKKFYSTILGKDLQDMEMPDGQYAFFPHDYEKGVGGGIIKSEGFEPSATGSIVYLNAMPDLSVHLARVEKAGGKILIPKMSIGGNGFMAHILDTEGNRVALHSMK